MKSLFYKLGLAIENCYRGYNILWQFVAIGLTYFIVTIGFDLKYFLFFQNTLAYKLLFPAAILGFFAPVLLPIIVILIGYFGKFRKTVNAGLAIGQATILGWCFSSLYKVFTGRPGPPEHLGTAVGTATGDISKIFRFGFDRGGIFSGWPSSHTTVSVGIATTLVTMFPENKWIKYISIIYAAYIALGVSVSIHWLSDVVAGIIFGIIIGTSIGKNFRQRALKLEL